MPAVYPDVKVTGVRLASSIPVVSVNLGAVLETVETTQMVISGAEAPESAAPVVEGERAAEGAEIVAAPKKRKTSAGRTTEGGAPQ